MTRKLVLQRLYKWAIGEKTPPTKATLVITNECDLKCLFCRGAFHKNSNKGELFEEEWIKIIKDGLELGIKEWTITGGEPFIKVSTVLKVIKIIKTMGMSQIVKIVTNGSFITSEVAEDIVKSGCNEIEIGIDGPDARTHDFLRGVEGSFENATNSTRYITEAKNMFEKDEPLIKIKTVLNAKNYDKLKDMVLLASSLGANALDVIPMRMYSENREIIEKEGLVMGDEQKRRLVELWEDVKKTGKNHGIKIIKSFESGGEEVSGIVTTKPPSKKTETDTNVLLFSLMPFHSIIVGLSRIIKREPKVPKSVNRFLSAFCYTPFYSLVIDSKGNVSPCSSIPPSEFENLIFLNLRETTLKDIWYGDFFELLRKMSIDGKQISRRCETCGLVKERKTVIEEFGVL